MTDDLLENHSYALASLTGHLRELEARNPGLQPMRTRQIVALDFVLRLLDGMRQESK